MIRTWAYKDEYEAEREEILAAVDRVFRSGHLILGESVRAFESEFAAYCGVRLGVGVGNGTDGLFLALKALRIGAGDEVITVANAAIATVAAIVATGATPVFVDIDADTLLMDVTQVERVVTPRSRAIIPVHLYGQCVDMEAVTAVAARHGLDVVEDCAQAHGATRNGQRAGSFGRAAVFSFYPTKPLGAYGDGGIVVTDDEDLAAHLRRLRFYGTNGSVSAEEDGYNSRLDEVHAEILRIKLPRLDDYINRRRAIAARYGELSSTTSLRLTSVLEGNGHAYHQYVVRHAERARVLARLAASEIELTVHYPVPIHLMPA
ncbi:MAG: sam30, partial [Gemmatimonadetes bacterium]|nr:sam30 [Gemmatimonadota bacterium]